MNAFKYIFYIYVYMWIKKNLYICIEIYICNSACAYTYIYYAAKQQCVYLMCSKNLVKCNSQISQLFQIYKNMQNICEKYIHVSH